MRLLVTRPEPDASLTAAKLRASGHDVLVQPLLNVTFNEPPAGLPDPAAILITSQNAARAIARWPQLGSWRDVRIFAAGPATGRAMVALGFTDVRTGAGDAGSLADLVIAELPKGAGSLLYPAARDRAGALAAGLLAHGYAVRIIEAYRADPVRKLGPDVRAAFVSGSIDGVLLYSGRTAKALRAVAAAEGIVETLAGPAYFVISGHVADVVRDLGARVEIAGHADEDSLLALIPAAR